MAGILRDRPVVAKVKTIKLTWESAKYIREYEHSHGPYADRPMSDKYWDRLKREFNHSVVDGYRQYTEDSFGYFVGERWHRITISDVAKLLDEQKLDYKLGDPVEVIYL